MVAWSCFASRNITKCSLALKVFSTIRNELNPGCHSKNVINTTFVRGHKKLWVEPSRFDYNKFKDLSIFYILLGVIPLLLLSFYCHVFIGPATLALIPEGYEPKPWEYHKNPITRFFAKYITMTPQEAHERTLHNVFYRQEKILLKQLEMKVDNLMKTRLDYQAYYTSPRSAKYARQVKEAAEEAEEHTIQSVGWIN